MRSLLHSIALLFISVVTASAVVLLDDSWGDGTRSDTALPAESAWFSSNAASLNAAVASLTGTTASGSSRSCWTHFTPNGAAPVTLSTGETLKVTLTFIPNGVAAPNSSRAWRIGLFDFSSGARTLADGASPDGTGVSGCALNLNFGTAFGTANPISIRKRTNVASADLMGSSSDFTTLPDGDGGGPQGSAGFLSGAVHTLAFTVTQTAAGAEITATFSRGDGWSITHTATDPAVVSSTFDGFALRPANSAQTAAEFVFTRLLVEKLNALPPAPPVIDAQPQPLTASAGSDVTFTVAASGAGPLSYQWQHNGAEIAGATAATLSLTNVQSGGSYSVAVTNPHGTTPSAAAALTVTPSAPFFIQHPADLAAITGDTVTFTATGRGTEPLTLVWSKDGAAIPGATAATLTLTNVQPSAEGSYRVTVSNSIGSAPSNPAALSVVTAPIVDAIYVAPAGTTAAPGTFAQPTTLASAITRVVPGGVILLRGGTYFHNVQITVARGNNGTSAQLRKSILAFTLPDGTAEVPVLDFSSQPYGDTSSVSNPRGLMLGGDWWHVRGLEVKGAADNGIYVGGNHNIVELCRTHACRDSGLQISRYASSDGPALWPSFNLILNCESWDNYDSPPNAGENADGFACKLTSGEGNVFRGCIAHHNIDDGWDLFTKTETGPIGSVTIDRCIAHSNGTLTDGTSNPNGDRNGFKLGGSDIPVVHTVTRSLAYGNGKNGFTWNSNPGAIAVVNNLAFNNAQGNFKFDAAGPLFYNNASLYTTGSGTNDRYGGASGAPTGATNCFWYNGGSINAAGISISAASFITLAPPAAFTRYADGGLNFGNFARPVAGHRLINGGTLPAGVALPYDATYYHSTPDIGLSEVRTGWHLWREQQFGEDNLALPHTGPAASPVDDGQPNALKYLLGLAATDPIPPALLPTLAAGPVGTFTYRWQRLATATDLTVTAKSSITLQTWTPVSAQRLSTAAPYEQWEAILPANPGSRLFLRLDLTTPAP